MAAWRALAGPECRAVLPDYLALPAGAGIAGPAVVTEDETTVVVPASRECHALGDGTLDVRLSRPTAAFERQIGEQAHV